VQAADNRTLFYFVNNARSDQFFLGEIVPEKCHCGPRASPEIRKKQHNIMMIVFLLNVPYV